MKQLIFLLYFGIVVYARPSHHHYNDVYPIHPGVGAIYKGPNSETIIEGPDGSVITSEADGGAVAVKGENVAVEAVNHVAVEAVNHAASQAFAHQAIANQVVAQQLSASAGAYVKAKAVSATPALVATAPVVIQEPVVVPVSVPQVVVAANVQDTAALDGPSGSILRHGEDAVISGPSSTTIKGGHHVVDIPNLELQTTLVGAHPVGPVISPGPILAPHFISSTPGPVLIDASIGPLKPRPVIIDAPHPVKPLIDPIPVLVDDTHLVGSTLGTSGPIVVADAKILQTPGPVLQDVSSVSIQNEVIPQVIVSSTPASVFHTGGPIVVAPSKAELLTPAINLSPPLIHSSTAASHIVDHANKAAVSAAIAKNVEAQQAAYLSALQHAEYEKALAAETERKSLEATIHASRQYEKALAAEAKRKSLQAAIQHSSVGYGGNVLVGAQPYLNPVVSQGNHVISGEVVSSTPASLGIISSTPAPILVTSLTPTHPDLVIPGKELVAVGPQVFQTNGIVSVTPKPEIAVASTAALNAVSSTVHPEVLDGAGPIISRPTAILTPAAPAGLGQIVVQSKTVSASESRAHSSSVQHTSSTGLISGPVVLGDGHGHRLPAGPHLGPPPNFADWHPHYHGGDRGFPVHKSFLH